MPNRPPELSAVINRAMLSKAYLRAVAAGMILYWCIVPFGFLICLGAAISHMQPYLAGTSGPLAKVIFRVLQLLAVVAAVAGVEAIKRLSRWFAPSLGLDLAIAENDRRFERWRKTPASQFSWKGIFLFTGGIALVSIVLAALLLAWQVSESYLVDKVYKIAVTNALSSLSAQAKYVEFSGTVSAKSWLAAGADRSVTREAFAVLTAPGQPLDRPAAYLAHYVARMDSSGKYESFYDEHGRCAGTFQGKVLGPIPPEIVHKYRDKGIQLDPACVLLEALPKEEMPVEHPISYDYSIGALVIGGMFVFFGLTALSLVKLMGRSAIQKQSPELKS
jgi:hypothetical protein